MISDGRLLSVDAVDLLLLIAESPGMAISATALDYFHKKTGAALMAAGAIKPDGFETVATSQADHEDAIVSLIWSSELDGYAYFSPAVGLIRIDNDRLRRFKLEFSWFLQWITGHLGFGTAARQVCLISGRLWDLGDIWIGATKRRQRRTAVYLARRLAEPATVTQIAAVLRMHRTRPGKVILTTSNDLELARTIIADTCAILTMKTCARAGIEDFEFDPEIIYSAAHGPRQSYSKSSVQADGDFRVVRVGDRQFRFRGDKQRQVLGLLYGRWERREGPVSTPLMFEELGWPHTKRVRDLFKGHPNWRELVGDKDGVCWLRCDEILSKAEDGTDAPQ